MLFQRRTWILWLGTAAILLVGCDNHDGRKIKLASDHEDLSAGPQTAASILRVSPEEQRTVAVLYFENATEDASLDWLRRGLTDMLVAELSQSPYLNVVTMKRLSEIATRLGRRPEELVDLSVAAMVASEGGVETLLTGRFYRDSDSLRIDVDLRQVDTGQLLRRETVRGAGLERIFLMVDELSQRVRTNLRGELEATRSLGVRLADMTQSIEAFRYYSRGLEALDKVIFAAADSFFRKAVEYDSTFAAAHLRLAGSSFAIGQRKAAQKALRLARRYADKLSQSDRMQLRLYEADLSGDVKKSLAVLQELLSYAPNDIDTRMQLANLFFRRLEDNDRAIEEYETILELDPSRKLAYNQLAYLYAFRGDFTTALKYLDTYEELAPDEPNPHDSRGEILMMAGRLEEAARSLKTALAKWPAFYQSAMRLTDIYSELGDLTQALRYSDMWIEQAPSDKVRAAAYTQRAAVLWRFGRIEEAKQALKLALKTSPTEVWPVLVGGEMYQAIGDTAAARQLYRSFLSQKELASTSGDYGWGKIPLLRVCLEANLPASEAFSLAQTLVGEETRALFREQNSLYLGLLALRAGEYERASQWLREEPSPDFYDVLTSVPGVGRSWVWKYLSEAIRYEPKQKKHDYASCDLMLDAARKADRGDLEVLALFMRAQYHDKYGRQEELAAEYQRLGTPLENNWRVIGPFPNQSGFDRHFPPEDSVDLEAEYQGVGGTITWQPAEDGTYDGFVDLRAILRRSSWAVGYAAVHVDSPEKRVVQIRMATDEACKLWLNDDLVWQAYRSDEAVLDHDIVTVFLRRGDNKLLMKVTNSIGDWGFYLRMTDEKGRGYPDLRFHAPGMEELKVAGL
jgi:tetratricopeptide (TPR) repeat protein